MHERRRNDGGAVQGLRSAVVTAMLSMHCVGDGSPTPQPPPTGGFDCAAGDVRGCSCGGGMAGTQSCARGEWATCVCATPTGCGPSRPTGSCPSGQTCVGGACCGAGQACGATCCAAGSVCVQDEAGARSCAQRCDTNGECPGAVGVRCCRTALDATTRAPLPYGACGTFVAGETTCRCATGADCGTGACTPTVVSGAPTAPYICTQPACAPYAACPAAGNCGAGYCNLCDDRDNCFCARTCTSDADCGGAQCVAYPRSNGSCAAGQRACAPR
jgi:hypothetical protein